MSKNNFLRKIAHWGPLLIIAIALTLFFIFGLKKYFTIESLKKYQSTLTQLIADHRLLSPIVYMALYALTTTFLLPVGVFLSIIGGFFFSHPLAELYILVGTTSGACVVYLAAKGPLHEVFLNKAGPGLKKLKRNLKVMM